MDRRNSPKSRLPYWRPLIVLSVFLIVYLAFLWREAEDEMTTVTKPIVDWRVADVASWLDSLGPWAREYRASFVDNAIDGQLVLALTDRDLQEPPFAMKLAVLVVTVIRATPIVDKFALAVEAAALQLAVIGIAIGELYFPAPRDLAPFKNAHQLVSFLRL